MAKLTPEQVASMGSLPDWESLTPQEQQAVQDLQEALNDMAFYARLAEEERAAKVAVGRGARSRDASRTRSGSRARRKRPGANSASRSTDSGSDGDGEGSGSGGAVVEVAWATRVDESRYRRLLAVLFSEASS